jgi:hypothetical protein
MPPGGAMPSSRADIDAIAQQIFVLDHDIAEIDADAELDAAVQWFGQVAGGHVALHLDGAANGIDDTAEFQEQAVTGCLDDATVMARERRLDQLVQQRLEPRDRAFLIGGNESAVAGHVGGNDRGEPALNMRVLQCHYLPRSGRSRL